MTDLYPRWQAAGLKAAMAERRVALLTGPRQCGKSTLARTLAADKAEYRTLDDQTLRQAAESDPHGFVRHDAPTLIIDEIQRVPDLLPAIKKVVDVDNRPGRFLLTGSVNVQELPSVRESLAGRIAKVRLRPLAHGELVRSKPRFLERAFAGSFDHGGVVFSRDELIEIAFRGGFPEAVRLDGRPRRRWHRDYVEALLDRDLRDIARIHRLDAMRDLVRVLAAWSSKLMDISAIGSGLSIRRPTLESYINALETLYVTERVRPWTRTDYDRVGKQDKLFMSDCGLMASVLGWRIDQVRLDADRVGKLFETLAFNESAAQIDAADDGCELFHYRDRQKREIDFMIERDDGALLGIEVKAAATVNKRDFGHLAWFRDNLAKDRPFTGIVLYAGEAPGSFGKGLWAVPFSAFWS
jgi:predicted AAA+ superfamily ATPase